MPPYRKNPYFSKRVPFHKRKWAFGVRYHGRHCGPYWSDGKMQPSVCGRRGIDAFDETCRDHDCRRRHDVNRRHADLKFFRKNWMKGVKRSLAAAAVYADGYLSGEWNSTPKKEINSVMLATPAKSSRSMSISSRSVISTGGSTVGGGSVVKFQAGTHMNKRHSMDTKHHLRNGVVHQVETTGDIFSSRTAYVGHINFPLNTVGLNLCRAIVKKLYHMRGTEFSNWQELIEITPGQDPDFVELIYYPSQTDTTPLGIIINTLSGTTTYDSLATALWEQATSVGPPFITSGLREVFEEYRNPRFTLAILDRSNTVSTVGYDKIQFNLEGAKFEMDFASIFKMQNVTDPTTGPDDTTAIEAQPLYFRSYEGKGTGTHLLGSYQTNNVPFVGSLTTGVIDVGTDNTTFPSALYELPYKEQFLGVKECKTGYFKPGEIMVSRLDFHKTMQFGTLAVMFNNIYTETYQFTRNGNFRFFGFDKVLQSEGTSVTLAYEHQQIYCISIIPGKKTVTMPINDTL